MITPLRILPFLLCAASFAATQPLPAHRTMDLSVPPPQPHFDPRTYGAKADGVTYDTDALQKAIDACGGTGGSVILSSGKYLSAELTLHGRMTLYLQDGAVLLGGTSPADYPVLLPSDTPAVANTRSLLYAVHADGLILDGPGTIDGQGKYVKMNGNESQRPSLIRIFQSKNVTVRNITLRNPRMWTEMYSECQHLLVDHILVDAPPVAINLDGIDVCDSSDATVHDCDITSEDDAICLKSHGDAGLQNILIEGNRATSTKANGIKLGTASVGPMTHIVIRDNVVLGARDGGLNIESVDGGAVSDFEVTNLKMSNVAQPVFIRLAQRVGNKSAGDVVPKARPLGSIDNITIEGLAATCTPGAKKAISTITAMPGAQVTNIHLSNCYFDMPGGMTKVPEMPHDKPGAYPQSDMFGDTPAYAFFIRNAKGVIFEHVVTRYQNPDSRPWLVQDNADVKTTNCTDLGVNQPPSNPGF